MRNLIILAILIAVIYFAWQRYKGTIREALIRKITEKLGDIPNLADKTTEELQDIWSSATGGGQ